MKKFLLFLVIAIASISIGLTIYYFSTDNEVILIRSSYLVIEDGDTISTDGLVDFKYKDEHTQLTFSAGDVDGKTILTYHDGEGFFTTESGKGGEGKIIITTTNRNYPELVVNVLVCDGSEEYPYIISSADALSQIGKEDSKYTTSKSYKLGADIIFPIADDVSWTPISSFSGVFDGNFYTISNITITNESAPTGMESVGFISTLEKDAVIKNLYIKGLSINVADRANVGSVVGYNKAGTIQTTEVTGVISSTKTNLCYVGGIVGRNEADTTKAHIDRCGFEGKVVVKGFDDDEEPLNHNQVFGGVAGYNYGGVVSESYFRCVGEGQISIGTGLFGGIVGMNEEKDTLTANIYDCYCFLANGVDDMSYSKMGGIVYDNSCTNGTNSVMGNYYYCGENEDGLSKLTNGNIGSTRTRQDKEKISENNNKFFTKEIFGNLAKENFVTYSKMSTNEKRFWAFDSVWEVSSSYPLLNIRSAVGSTYLDGIDDIKGDEVIDTAEELYNKLKANPTGAYVLRGQKEGDNWVIDFGGLDWVWGDENHPLFAFSGILAGLEERVIIKNLKIVNIISQEEQETINVGLFTTTQNAKFSRLDFVNATITYDHENVATRNVSNVGLLAGTANDNVVYDVTIDGLNVDLAGKNFGGFFGVSTSIPSSACISNVTVKNVDARNGYFVIAGGFVGENRTVIIVDKIGEEFSYNTLENIQLYGNCVGGVAGRNYSTISYIDASGIKFVANENTDQKVFVGQKSIAVGGIAGINEGHISRVYSNLSAEIASGRNYIISVGGLIGYNFGLLNLGYASGPQIKVTGDYGVYAGGLAGANNGGTILSSVVEKGYIDCSVENHNTKITNLSNVSIVGGLVGFDGKTTNNFSITGCVSYITSLKGAFVGGLVGDANGIIEKSHSGSQSRSVSITGFVAGGLAGIVPGKIRDCYTVCTLSGVYTDSSYDGISSIVDLKASTIGGFTAVLMNSDSEIKGCYAVVNFKDGGVRFSTCADLSSKYTQGKVVGGIYTTEGTVGLNNFGKIISTSDLNGTGDTSYQLFYKNIGSDDPSVWDVSKGGFPQLDKVDDYLPTSRVTEPVEGE